MPASTSRGWTSFETVQDVVEAELKDGPWLFGDSFTAADVMIGSMFIWLQRFGGNQQAAFLESLAAVHAFAVGDRVQLVVIAYQSGIVGT